MPLLGSRSVRSIEAVDHRGEWGAKVASAAGGLFLPIMVLAVILAGLTVWHLTRRFYRGFSVWARVAALGGVGVMLASNAFGIVYLYFAWMVCGATGTGCSRPPTEWLIILYVGMAGALVLAGWWLSIPRRSQYVGLVTEANRKG